MKQRRRRKTVTRLSDMSSVLASIEATPGLSLNAERRGGSTSSYTIPRERGTDRQHVAIYRKDRMAARIVETLPQDATRRGWDLEVLALGGEEDDESSQTLQEIASEGEAYLRSIKTRELIREALSVARLKGEAILVIGADDGAYEVQSVGQPLEHPQTIKWLRIYGNGQFARGPVDEDPASESFGEPQSYLIAVGGSQLEFHASRVVHFYGHKVPGEFVYQSVLESIGRELDDYRKAHGSAAACIEDFSRVAYGMKGLAEAARKAGGAAQVVARLQTMERALRQLGVYLYDADNERVDYQTRGVAGLEGLLHAANMRLCAVSGTPMTRLLGDSPGGLGTGDHETSNWDDEVESYQTDVVVPAVAKIARAMFRCADSPTRGREPDKWVIKARPLRQPQPKQEAELRETLARFAATLVENHIITPEEAAQSLFGRGELGYNIRLDKEAREGLAELEAESSAELEAELEATRGTENAENVQAQALNGGQIQALLEVLDAVAAGKVPKLSAARLLTIAFPAQVDAVMAASLLEPIEEKERRAPPPQAPPPPPQEPAADGE